jgi:hypothetical protein
MASDIGAKTDMSQPVTAFHECDLEAALRLLCHGRRAVAILLSSAP